MSSKNKQRKAVARAKYEAYLERRAERARRHRRHQIIAGVVVVTVIVAGFALVNTGVLQDDPPAQSDAPATEDPPSFDQPTQVLQKDAPTTATLVTDRGDITIDLETTRAPKNSNSIAFLAGEGYFDNTVCHRLTTTDSLSVLQCGDPLGTGVGGPGYTIPDENLPKAGDDNYPAGTVAMAEPGGGEAGSQFFLVYRDSTLPPDYTIVGQIGEGLDIVREIAQGGVADGGDDGEPAEPVTIETVTIEQN